MSVISVPEVLPGLSDNSIHVGGIFTETYPSVDLIVFALIWVLVTVAWVDFDVDVFPAMGLDELLNTVKYKTVPKIARTTKPIIAK